MSKGILKMPRLGETMEEGRIVSWLVEPGQSFERGETLVEVETDKTVVEVPALGAGTLVGALVAEGETVAVGAPIAQVDIGAGVDWTAENDDPDAPGDDGALGDALVDDAPAGLGAPMVGAASAPAGVFADAGDARDARDAGYAGDVGGDRVRATPPARRLARHSGIDIAGLHGTGRRGRIERADVQQAIAARDLGATPAGDDAVMHRNGIAYVERGDVRGVPVVLLHGFAADHGIWAGLISGLIKSGAHILAPDMPGHGASTAGADTPGDLARGLASLVGSVFGGDAVHLVAHSLGAIPALALAGRLPLLSLSLIAPAGLGSKIDEAFITGLAQAGSTRQVADLLGRMTEAATPLSQSAISLVQRDLGQGRLRALAATLVGPQDLRPDIRADLARLAQRIPVRIVVGHRDQIISWPEAASVSPRIAVHHLPQVGHMPQWEALPQVLAILKQAIAPAPDVTQALQAAGKTSARR